MKCPHCNKAIHFEESDASAYEYSEPQDGKTGYDVANGFCPACGELIVLLRNGKYVSQSHGSWLTDTIVEQVLYPTDSSERALADEVPDSYRRDFDEASAVLPYSPKASAAISRRLLQQILREHFGIRAPSLAKEIERFVELPEVPSYISDAVDAVRNVGNLAAHPTKDQNTGEVVDVEPGEADWLLDVLDSLCDFAFVQPKRLEERRRALNEKLANLGKSQMLGKSGSAGASPPAT